MFGRKSRVVTELGPMDIAPLVCDTIRITAWQEFRQAVDPWFETNEDGDLLCLVGERVLRIPRATWKQVKRNELDDLVARWVRDGHSFAAERQTLRSAINGGVE